MHPSMIVISWPMANHSLGQYFTQTSLPHRLFLCMTFTAVASNCILTILCCLDQNNLVHGVRHLTCTYIRVFTYYVSYHLLILRIDTWNDRIVLVSSFSKNTLRYYVSSVTVLRLTRSLTAVFHPALFLCCCILACTQSWQIVEIQYVALIVPQHNPKPFVLSRQKKYSQHITIVQSAKTHYNENDCDQVTYDVSVLETIRQGYMCH